MESEKAPAPRAQSTTVGVEADSQFKAKYARALNLGYAALRYKRFVIRLPQSFAHANSP